jgi:GT2 family glycosyltransferase
MIMLPNTNNRVDVSVIIVNHNTRKLCEGAIESIPAAVRNRNVEIIVVDNSSDPMGKTTEGALTKEFADSYQVKLYDNNDYTENKGFAHACNFGARHSSGNFLLFLNPDTVLGSGAIDTAIAEFDNGTDEGSEHDIGIVGMNISLPDGNSDKAAMRGFPTPWRSFCYFTGLDRVFPKTKLFGGYHLTWLEPEKSHDVDSVTGASLMIPRQLYRSIGGFDEDYYMFGEDIDICKRIQDKGFRIRYCAGAKMLHIKGQSVTGKQQQVNEYFFDSMIIFYDKHYVRKYGPIIATVVKVAIRYMKKRNLRK